MVWSSPPWEQLQSWSSLYEDSSSKSTNQQEPILEELWEEKYFEEDLEGEEWLFGTWEDGTALDLKSACYKDTECYGKNKSKRSVIFIIITVWVDQRRQAWERGWHEASAGEEEQRCKWAKALVVRKVRAVHGRPFWFLLRMRKKEFPGAERDTRYILLSYVRSLPRIYIVGLMCAFLRIFLCFFPLFYVVF